MGCRHEVDAADPAAAVVAHQAISAEWLSAALQHQGIAAVVGDFTVETISAGQLGEVRRCHLRYSARCPPQAPTSLIGKFPSADDVAASTGRRLGIYRAEVMFYRELAARAAIRTPRPDVAAIDDPHNFVLLLEDLAPATAGDHLRGCAVADARKAVSDNSRVCRWARTAVAVGAGGLSEMVSGFTRNPIRAPIIPARDASVSVCQR